MIDFYFDSIDFDSEASYEASEYSSQYYGRSDVDFIASLPTDQDLFNIEGSCQIDCLSFPEVDNMLWHEYALHEHLNHSDDFDFPSFEHEEIHGNHQDDLWNNPMDYSIPEHDTHNLSHDDIMVNKASGISFGSSEGNRYDRNALDFLKECHDNNIEFPSTVDHSLNNTNMKVDRSINGGFTSIDKTIMKNTIEKYYSNGKITEDIYNNLLRELTNC